MQERTIFDARPAEEETGHTLRKGSIIDLVTETYVATAPWQQRVLLVGAVESAVVLLVEFTHFHLLTPTHTHTHTNRPVLSTMAAMRRDGPTAPIKSCGMFITAVWTDDLDTVKGMIDSGEIEHDFVWELGSYDIAGWPILPVV